MRKLESNFRLESNVVFRVRDQELDVLKTAATIRDESLSSYLRRVTLAAARATVETSISDRDA